jgi:hypothetical protein
MRHAIDPIFYEYDYVGAPCIDQKTFNGGLSLRNVRFFQKVLESDNWVPNMAEDIWWSSMCRKYHGRLPSFDIAKQFSMEAIESDNPMGLHQIYQYHNVPTIMHQTKCLLPTVVATLTTMPKRIQEIQKTLDSLRLQVAWIEINVPKKSKRTGESYIIPDWILELPYVRVYEVPEDLGPITKVWPTMVRHGCLRPVEPSLVAGTYISKHSIEATSHVPQFLCVVDDDRIYEPTKIIDMLAEWKPFTVVSGYGASLEALYAPIWSRLRPIEGPCDLVQGFAGYLFKCATFTVEPQVDLILHDMDAFKCDDVIISNFFKEQGMMLHSICKNQMKETTSNVSALSNEDNYVERIRRVLTLLRSLNQSYL